MWTKIGLICLLALSVVDCRGRRPGGGRRPRPSQEDLIDGVVAINGICASRVVTARRNLVLTHDITTALLDLVCAVTATVTIPTAPPATASPLRRELEAIENLLDDDEIEVDEFEGMIAALKRGRGRGGMSGGSSSTDDNNGIVIPRIVRDALRLARQLCDDLTAPIAPARRQVDESATLLAVCAVINPQDSVSSVEE